MKQRECFSRERVGTVQDYKGSARVHYRKGAGFFQGKGEFCDEKTAGFEGCFPREKCTIIASPSILGFDSYTYGLP